MNQQETRKLLDLALRLGATPKRVLVEAAMMSERATPDAQQSLHRIRVSGIRTSPNQEVCARLMLTPVDSFARDSMGKALHALWQGSGQTD